MKTRSLLVAIVVVGGFAGSASAQTAFNPNPPVGAPYSRPALSPYLNLLRGGNPAANYYMGVLTEYDRRYQQSRIGLPNDTPILEPTLDDRADLDVPDRRLPPTGHPAGFLLHQGYFNLPNQRSFVPYNPSAGPKR
jgi:hypothetical protein